MSENIPESIPTSADPRSKRATKKRALTPRTGHAADVDALFAKPDRDIHIPGSNPKKGIAAPPEIVANVQGSSAGAGSGEFHVYKASRRREFERQRLMNQEKNKEEAEKAFRERKEELERKDKEKTDKNRARREKQKARKAKQRQGKKAENGESNVTTENAVKKKLPPNPAGPRVEENGDDGVPEGGEVKNADEIGLVIQDDDD